MTRTDRARIAELLACEERSYRSIARELGLSDWTVRKIARELDGDPRPMKYPHRNARDDPEAPRAAAWIGAAAMIGLIGLTLWFGYHRLPPPEM